MNFFVENAYITALLPLWAFLIILFGTTLTVYENKKNSLYITTITTFIGLIFSCFILAWSINNPEQKIIQDYIWLNAGNIKLSIGWMLDNLSAVMLMIVTSISLLVQIYTHGYMNKDEGYHRFYAYLALFNFSMIGLVISSNLFQTYIFWELVGVSSYLLIGFWFRRPSAANAAKKAFIINRIGDFGLLAGILIFLFSTMTYWTQANITTLGFGTLSYSLQFIELNPLMILVMTFCLFMGPMAKSAQFPLHTWLPDAMEGPTPISALIHAATMVAAGVFLIARIFPIFELSPAILAIMSAVGAFTAIATAIIAVTQTDIKKALAYSTCSQLGYMILAMGIGAVSAGMFHLLTHAYFKAMLFLCSGAVIHGVAGQQDMRYMGGLRKHMPVVAWTYLIGTLSISGILLSGFWSKEAIFSGLLEEHRYYSLAVALIVAGLTSFYMFKTYFLTFEGEYRGHSAPHNSGNVMTIPLILLAIPSVLLGFMLSGNLANIGLYSFSSFLRFEEHIASHHNWWLPLMSMTIAVIGFIISAAMYWDKFPIKLNPEAFKQRLIPAYGLSINKWYVDDIQNAFVKNIFMPFARFLSEFDKLVIDGIVNLTALLAQIQGYILRVIQNGNIQTYTTVALCWLTIISASILVLWLFV